MSRFIKPFVVVALLVMHIAKVGAEMPDYYDEPGVSPYRELEQGLSAEAIDPFSGQLTVKHIDLAIPGNGGMDLSIQRTYSVHSAVKTTTTGALPRFAQSSGVGWAIHFGRVYYEGSLFPGACRSTQVATNQNPVLELSDGSKRQLVNSNQFILGSEEREPAFITKDRWIADCISEPYEENGQTYNFGGLLVTSPDGTRYTFNRKIRVEADVFAWVVTKIEDLRGNTLTVNYLPHDTNAIGLIDTVRASDGRTVQFRYVDESAFPPLLESISSSGRSVRYNYERIDGFLADHYYLTSATQSEGYQWVYRYGEDSKAPFVMNAIFNPYGGETHLTFDRILFESDVQLSSIAVKTKTTKGAGVKPGLWSYDYNPGLNSDVTTVTGPGAKEVYEHIGTRAADFGTVWKIGALVKKSIYPLGSGVPVQVEELDWGKAKISIQNEYRSSRNVVDEFTSIPVLRSKTITRGGRTFKAEYSDFNGLGIAHKVVEKIDGTSSVCNGDGCFYEIERKSDLFYKVDLDKWLIAYQGASVNDGPYSGVVLNAVGLPEKRIQFGYQSESYRYDSEGNLSEIIYPDNFVETRSQYRRGVPQEINARSGKTLQVVNSDGTVESVTNARNFKTSYLYDGLGRVKTIVPPIGNPISIDWDLGFNVRKTVIRGDYKDVKEYDGFGRELNRTLSAPGLESVRLTKSYDELGRLRFSSYANEQSLGQHFEYDELGRLREKNEAGGKITQYDYPNGDRMLVTDPENHVTIYKYAGFSDPDSLMLMEIIDPLQGVTKFDKDANGTVHSISRGGITRSYLYNEYLWLRQVDEPETGQTVYQYDVLGNVKYKYVNGGLAATYLYDNTNRLRDVLYPTHTLVNGVKTNSSNCRAPCVLERIQLQDHFDYDAVDNVERIDRATKKQRYQYLSSSSQPIISTVDDNNSWRMTYDANNSLKTEDLYQNDKVVAEFGYYFNGNDVLSGVVYPSGARVEYAPDAYGRSTQAGDYIRSATYYPNGQLKTLVHGNGVTSSFGQSIRKLPEGITVDGGSRIVDLSYQYNLRDNLQEISDHINPSHSKSLSYDALNRLDVAGGPWGRLEYGYDGVDNVDWVRRNGQLTDYQYDALNRLDVIRSQGNESYFNYDPAGFLTRAGVMAYAYDAANNLASVGPDLSYVYDGRNKRLVSQNRSSGQRYSFYTASGKLMAEEDEAAHIYAEKIYFSGQLVAESSVNYGVNVDLGRTTALFYLQDGSNNVSAPFKGHALDRAGSPLTLTWHSSIDGDVGRGDEVVLTLSEGVHRMTAYAVDSRGRTYSKEFTVLVLSEELAVTSDFMVGDWEVLGYGAGCSVPNKSVIAYMSPVGYRHKVDGFHSIDAKRSEAAVYLDGALVGTSPLMDCNRIVDVGSRNYEAFLSVKMSADLTEGEHTLSVVSYVYGALQIYGQLVEDVVLTLSAQKTFVIQHSMDADDQVSLGSSAGEVHTGAGNDSIVSVGAGHIYPGSGDDYIESADGDVIYIGPGEGVDRIVGGGKVALGPDIQLSDLVIRRGPGVEIADENVYWTMGISIKDLVIFIKDSPTSTAGHNLLVFKGYFGDAIHHIQTPAEVTSIRNIGFADGSELTTDMIFDAVLQPTSDSDRLIGYFGRSNVLQGEDGDDYLHGGDKDDLIEGRAGNDGWSGEFIGENVEYRLLNVDVHSALFGHDGNDTIRGGAGDDMIIGGFGAKDNVEHWWDIESHFDYSYYCCVSDTNFPDRIGYTPTFIGEDNDSLYGDEGDDAIRGGAGNDLIVGGLGDDALSGGIGNDTFIYRLGDGNDVIYGYIFEYSLDIADREEGTEWVENYPDVYLEGLNDLDVIELQGICPESVTLSKEGEDLLVHIGDGSQLTLRQFYNEQAGGVRPYAIDRLQFDDGVYWPLQGMAQNRLSGQSLPALTVINPSCGKRVTSTGFVSLQAAAVNIDGADLSDVIQWHSDLEGDLGVGATFEGTLAEGEHLITVSVVNAEGARSHRYIAVTVTAQVNTAPVLQLLAPAAESEHSTQAPALLEATAMDQEDGDLSAAIHWQSSLQGDLGVGSALSVVLQAGQHTLSATVTDSRGLSAQQSVTVTVTAPPPGPVAHAGAGGAIVAGQSVLLDGSASVAAADSQWLWQQLAGDRVVINGADAIQASFNAPYRTTAQTLVFSLRITDAQGQISEAQVTYSLAAAKTLDQLGWLSRPLVVYWEAQLANSELPDWLRSIYEGLLAWVLG